MILTAPQHSRIAAAYEHASTDNSLPVQARSAFANKASWFRMIAEIGTAKQAMTRRRLSCGTPSSPACCHASQRGNIVFWQLTPFACGNDLPLIAAEASPQPFDIGV